MPDVPALAEAARDYGLFTVIVVMVIAAICLKIDKLAETVRLTIKEWRECTLERERFMQKKSVEDTRLQYDILERMKVSFPDELKRLQSESEGADE